MVEIEGSTPETFKTGVEFSDEEGSGIEFYSNHELPEDITEMLGALAIDFINDIGDLVLQNCTDHQPTGQRSDSLKSETFRSIF